MAYLRCFQGFLYFLRGEKVYLLDKGERLGSFIGGYRDRFFKPDKRNKEIIYSYKPRDGA